MLPQCVATCLSLYPCLLSQQTMAVANDIYRLSVDKTTMNIERLTTDGSIESGIYNGLNDQLYRG